MTKKASTSAPAPKKKKSTVTTGDIRAGGDVVLGNKTTVGGDYAGRDMVKSTGLQAAEVAQLFDSIYRQIGRASCRERV